MKIELFHDDNGEFFNLRSLRDYAAQVVGASSLIRAARSGNRQAAIALKIGFWPFVREFETAIDRQVLPRHQLAAKFGERRVRHIFLGIAGAVREMKKEEGTHAAHWLKDARCLGLESLDAECMPGVEALIARSYTKDIPSFFATLAGTEFIAEELSRFLSSSSAFTGLFTRKRWIWGEVHVASHEHGPSHLDIDMDLARAYSTTNDASQIEAAVRQTVMLFGRAAEEVEAEFLPQLIAA
jgi:hypothetical protein